MDIHFKTFYAQTIIPISVVVLGGGGGGGGNSVVICFVFVCLFVCFDFVCLFFFSFPI